LLKSLEKQTDTQASYFLFQDGAVNPWSHRRKSRDKNISECLNYFDRADIPNKQSHLRDGNIGVAYNIKGAFDTMAKDYERIMMVEDDVLLSPHWLKMAHSLFEQMEQRPHIASFSPGFRRLCDMADTNDKLNTIQETVQHMWCECFTAKTWEKMQPHLAPYYELVTGIDYMMRDDDPIIELHKSRGSKETGTSQDVARVVAIELLGMKRAQCTVNRGMSIGRQGIHFDNERYIKYKLGEQTPYIFDADATREGFDWEV